MELIKKDDKQMLKEFEQFASTSRYGNFMQSILWPKVKDNWGWDAVIRYLAARFFTRRTALFATGATRKLCRTYSKA